MTKSEKMKPPPEVKQWMRWMCGGLIIYGIAAPFIFGSLEKSGQFGDTFGAINALFSAMAFLGVLYTIMIQREELELTRNELSRSASAQEKSESSLKEQVRVSRDAALLSALDTLIRQNSDIIEKDSLDEIARRLPHYSAAKRKVAHYTKLLEEKIESLERS